MSEQTDKVAGGHSGRGMKILLAISLAFNMLVVGIFVGAFFSRDKADNGPTMRELSYGPYARALDPEVRKQIYAQVLREAGSSRENLRQVRASFGKLIKELRSEEYDRVKIRHLIEAQQAAVQRRPQIGLRLMLEQLDAMTPEQRAKFADRLEKAVKKGLRPRPDRKP